jgi:transposase
MGVTPAEVWSAARQDLAKAKQRLKSFLLVHDVRYAGRCGNANSRRLLVEAA